MRWCKPPTATLPAPARERRARATGGVGLYPRGQGGPHAVGGVLEHDAAPGGHVEAAGGEPQRIGLSATARPLEEVARFLGGERPVETGVWSRVIHATPCSRMLARQLR